MARQRVPLDIIRLVYAKCDIRERAAIAAACDEIWRHDWTESDVCVLLADYASRKGALSMNCEVVKRLFERRDLPTAERILEGYANNKYVMTSYLKEAIATRDWDAYKARYGQAVDLGHDTYMDVLMFVAKQTPEAFDAFRATMPTTFRSMTMLTSDRGDILRYANPVLAAHVIALIHTGSLWSDSAPSMRYYFGMDRVRDMLACGPAIPEATWKTVLSAVISFGLADVAKGIMAEGYRL